MAALWWKCLRFQSCLNTLSVDLQERDQNYLTVGYPCNFLQGISDSMQLTCVLWHLAPPERTKAGHLFVGRVHVCIHETWQ